MQSVVKSCKFGDYVAFCFDGDVFIHKIRSFVNPLDTNSQGFEIDAKTDVYCGLKPLYEKRVFIRKCQIKNLVVLKPVKVNHVKVSVIYNESFKTQSIGVSKWLRYILKHYGLPENGIVNCQQHSLAKLIGIDLLILEINSLKPNQVAKVSNNTVIDVVSELDRELFEAQQERTSGLLKNHFHSEEAERDISAVLHSLFKTGNKFSPVGFKGLKGFLLVDPSSFNLNQLISKCIWKCGAVKMIIHSSDLLRETIGESEAILKEKLFKALNWSKKTSVVIVIEDIDSIFPNSNRKGQPGVSKRLLSVFLNFLSREESQNLLVLATVRSVNDLHPSLLRPGRLDKKVIISNLTYDERLVTLRNIFSHSHLSEDVVLEEIAEKTPGYGASDLLNLWQLVVYNHLEAKNVAEKIDSLTIEKALLSARPSAYKSTSSWKVQISPVSWDDIVGMEKIKKRIKMAVEWPLLHSKSFQRLGVNQSKGILLFGPPGCCKTTLIRAVASMCKTTFLSATPAQIFSPYVGDSSKAITEIFQAARSATPALIFFDEIESLVGSRDFGSSSKSTQRGPQEQVLSTLLNEMDGIGATPSFEKGNVLVVGVTNRFDMLDAALLRPGRFDTIVYVGLPNQMEREAIFAKVFEKLTTREVDVKFLAEKTEWFSGADIKNLCQEAALKGLDEDIQTTTLQWKHFEYALENVCGSMNASQLKWFHEICLKHNIPIE